MLSDLLPLFAALLGATALYILRERRRRERQVRPPEPDLPIDDAWRRWRAQGGNPPARLLQAIQAELFAIEQECLAADHPRLALRAVLLRHALMGQALEELLPLPDQERQALIRGYEAGQESLLDDAIAYHGALVRVLRLYAARKYDDAVPRDWFDHFHALAQPYLRERVRLGREHLLSLNDGAARFAARYDDLLRDLQDQMLRVPPKQRFPPPDLR